jgi:hypothetical protein
MRNETSRRIIDGDGHIVEDNLELFEYLPPPYSGRRSILATPFFPTGDGFQRLARRVADDARKERETPKITEWKEFLDLSGDFISDSGTQFRLHSKRRLGGGARAGLQRLVVRLLSESRFAAARDCAYSFAGPRVSDKGASPRSHGLGDGGSIAAGGGTVGSLWPQKFLAGV